MKKLTRDETEHGQEYYLAAEVDALLAQPAQEQWKCIGPPCKCNASNAKQCCYAVFTAPPQREWVGLTPENILALFDEHNLYGSRLVEFARAVETKIKDKNT